jgi:hypothetical protein
MSISSVTVPLTNRPRPLIHHGYSEWIPVATLISLTASCFLIFCNIATGTLSTCVLAVLVTTLGVLLVYRSADRVRDHRLRWLAGWHLVRIPLLLSLLFWAWVPGLELVDADTGYDPQRYYYQSAELLATGSHFDLLSSINYAGILYYYSGIFLLFGHNPAAPALVNALTTLFAVLVVVEAAYRVMPRGWNGVHCGMILMVPEILWYDVITSRESIAMALFVCGTVPLGMAFLNAPRARSLGNLALSIASLAGLGFIRTSMLFAACTVVAVLFLLFGVSSKKRLLGLVTLGFIAFLVWLVPKVIADLRAFHFDFASTWRSSRELVDAERISWSHRSIGQWLIPRSSLEEIAYMPLRTVAYLVIPLPSISFEWQGLVSRDWEDWQNFLTTLSSCLYVWYLPLAVGASWRALTCPHRRNQLLLCVPCWLGLVAVGMGNLILMPRYRIMVIGLYWATVSLCDDPRDRLVGVLRIVWWIGVFAGIMFYVYYKF